MTVTERHSNFLIKCRGRFNAWTHIQWQFSSRNPYSRNRFYRKTPTRFQKCWMQFREGWELFWKSAAVRPSSDPACLWSRLGRFDWRLRPSAADSRKWWRLCLPSRFLSPIHGHSFRRKCCANIYLSHKTSKPTWWNTQKRDGKCWFRAKDNLSHLLDSPHEPEANFESAGED